MGACSKSPITVLSAHPAGVPPLSPRTQRKGQGSFIMAKPRPKVIAGIDTHTDTHI